MCSPVLHTCTTSLWNKTTSHFHIVLFLFKKKNSVKYYENVRRTVQMEHSSIYWRISKTVVNVCHSLCMQEFYLFMSHTCTGIPYKHSVYSLNIRTAFFSRQCTEHYRTNFGIVRASKHQTCMFSRLLFWSGCTRNCVQTYRSLCIYDRRKATAW